MIDSRRFKLYGVGFGGSFPHEIGRLSALKWREYTATEEDEEYRDWALKATCVADDVLFVPKLAEMVAVRRLGEISPIPGSERACWGNNVCNIK